mmetsp:Transcript_17316/g.34467  ORF Transcript_17316/g.34467 Transcript_17316/m.34467 type:complete len:200 (-) Transcript_17316:292-891(-)
MRVASIFKGEFWHVGARLNHGGVVRELGGEPGGYGRVVRGGKRKRARRVFFAESEVGPSILDLRNHLIVLIGISNDGRKRVVLGRTPEHTGPPDVDVLDALGEISALRHGGAERVQVQDRHIDRPDAVGDHVRLVFFVPADGQDSAVDLRVEGLDAPVEAFGASRMVAHVRYGDAGGADGRGGAARGEELGAGGMEGLR